MESSERREPQGTGEDLEQGTPQEQLVGDEPSPDESEARPQGDVGAPQEGGADSPSDAAREGG
jgi:hypothetical protein